MLKLTLLEATYLKESFEDIKEWVEGDPVYQGRIGDTDYAFERIENSLEILKQGILNVEHEDIPLSIESWRDNSV